MAVDRGGIICVLGFSYATWGTPLRPHSGGSPAGHRRVAVSFLYLLTCSASFLVLALTLLWSEKPEWRQAAIFSTRFSKMSSRRRR